MAKALTGRITSNLIAGIIVTVVTVVVTIVWMAHQHDKQAAEGTYTMVVGGVDAMERRLETLASDYSWWEEAYDAFVRGDGEWIEANIGSGITESEISDMLFIISPQGELAYGWAVDEEAPAQSVITADRIPGIQHLVDDLPIDEVGARVGFIDTGDAVMMIAVSRITPASKIAEISGDELPLLAQGIYLSEDRLGALGESFLIGDLRFERLAPDAEVAADEPTVVTSLDGTVLGRFVWTPPKPGRTLLRNVLGPITIALLLFCAVALATAFRARRMAIALSESEKEAVTAARTDSLTKLVNRAGFSELLDSREYREACEEGGLAIIYLDINGFKTVNDSIGHHGGDELVKSLADRLLSVLPANARFGRIGGDEFAVALIGKNARDTAAGAASALVHALDEPFTVFGFEFHVTAAVGYAVSGGTSVTPGEVLRRADVAMYQAKNTAERDALAYNATMETGALEKKQVETALRKALEAGELTIAYQPIVRAGDLSLFGLEALVRWNSEEFGSISPAVFVPVAEETGLIHDLGKFVIGQVCTDLAKWPDLTVAVNISPVQLRDPNFASDLLALIQRHGARPEQIELELTEGILVNNPTIAKRKLETLKDMGFSLSLDDFGTGFSSIGYLRQFPFDKLKVDRSFVRELGVNGTANALIQALVSLGDAMDLAVVAEGIEHEEQLKLLRLVQCEYIQGFYVSRPMPVESIDSMIASLGPDRRLTPSLMGPSGGSAEAQAASA